LPVALGRFFLGAIPSFQLLFTLNGIFQVQEMLIINQVFATVAGGELRPSARVVTKSLTQVGGNAYVKFGSRVVGEYVNVIVSHRRLIYIFRHFERRLRSREIYRGRSRFLHFGRNDGKGFGNRFLRSFLGRNDGWGLVVTPPPPSAPSAGRSA
jgi:hypothetical protein